MVGTPSFSFGHNLCFRCPNGSCELILDIYVPRAFQWYKKLSNPLSFNPYNCYLKIQKSTKTLTLKVKAPLEVWGFIPSHFPTLPGIFLACNFASLCLGRKPKAKVVTIEFSSARKATSPRSIEFYPRKKATSPWSNELFPRKGPCLLGKHMFQAFL